MKFLSFIVISLSIGTLFILSSCSDKSEVVGPESPPKEVTEVVPDAIEQITVEGSFRSVNGVMDKLSCYTSNGGYIKTEDGERIAVSFKENEVVSSCERITVTGYMTSRRIESNGPCSEGIMSFLKVQSYAVGETDF